MFEHQGCSENCALCIFTPKTPLCSLHPPIHQRMVQTAEENCLSFNSPQSSSRSSVFFTMNRAGVPWVEANIIRSAVDHHHGEECTPFPPKASMSVVFVL